MVRRDRHRDKDEREKLERVTTTERKRRERDGWRDKERASEERPRKT